VVDLLAPGDRPEDAYGALFGADAAVYDETSQVGADHAEWVLDRLGDLCPEASSRLSGKVVEIGSGTGPLTHALRRRNETARLWISDLSPEMLRINWKKTHRLATPEEGIEYVRCNAVRMPFADASMDAVIGFDILHHILDYRVGLREFARLLTPGGVAIVKEPHRNASRFLSLFSGQLEAMDRSWNPFRGLTRSDRRLLSTWRTHTRDLIHADETENLEGLAGLDDKYTFRPDQLRLDAQAAGFARFEEVNVLARGRPSHFEDGMFFADMLNDWMRGVGLSPRGRAWAESAIELVDYWMGDVLLEVAPMNTVFVFWK
jgi:ubiquinone/menaquinone biosynthesis C-methylase UbiE